VSYTLFVFMLFIFLFYPIVFMFMHRELMFKGLEHMFTGRELMFIVREHNFLRYADTFSCRIRQINPPYFSKYRFEFRTKSKIICMFFMEMVLFCHFFCIFAPSKYNKN